MVVAALFVDLGEGPDLVVVVVGALPDLSDGAIVVAAVGVVQAEA